MPPWRESHVAVPVVEEVLEQLEELLLVENVIFANKKLHFTIWTNTFLLPRDVRRQHHRAHQVGELREL